MGIFSHRFANKYLWNQISKYCFFLMCLFSIYAKDGVNKKGRIFYEVENKSCELTFWRYIFFCAEQLLNFWLKPLIKFVISYVHINTLKYWIVIWKSLWIYYAIWSWIQLLITLSIFCRWKKFSHILSSSKYFLIFPSKNPKLN